MIHEPAAFAAACEDLRREGRRLGLVPTMGALHAGHLALVDAARAQGADAIALTLFVNPLQFDRTDDLQRYPRTLEEDRLKCEAAGVDLIFAPVPEAMYPPDFQTHVSVGPVADALEGAHRPGHFLGVTTVVAKLFHLAGPCIAVFGRKDYQQWRVIERMVDDLAFPVEVVGHPIVREEDGLALSSRNRLLSSADRSRALGLRDGLTAAASAFQTGERDCARLLALARAPIEDRFDSIDYVALVDPATLQPIEGSVGHAVLLAAAHLGAVRLIDNVELVPAP